MKFCNVVRPPIKRKRKPDALLFFGLLAVYTALSLGWEWYMHHPIDYPAVRDALSVNVASAGLTWAIAWYRWHKADSA